MVMGGVCVHGQGTANLEMMELKAQLETSARLVTELETKLAAEKSHTAALSQSVAAANNQATQARES